jgi:hypothetical protein
VFHTLEDGTAIQGFVGKDVRLNPTWSSQLHRSIQYGMAVQRPLLSPGQTDGLSNCYLFLEALGRYRFDGDVGQGTAAVWELLPGVHWKLRDNWWISGGVILPVGTTTPDARLLQFTCSFRF